MISIILHVHNRDEQLKRTLETFKNQTYQDFEVNVAETANMDSTLQILKCYNKYFNINCYKLHTKFIDKTKALNFLASKSNGEIICIADADVLKQHDYFYEIFQKTKDNNFLIQYVKYLDKSVSEELNFEVLLENSKEIILNDMGVSQIALTKINFIKIGGFDEYFFGWGGEDNDLYNRLINFGLKQEIVESYGIHIWHKISWEFRGFSDGTKNRERLKENLSKGITIVKNNNIDRHYNQQEEEKTNFEETSLQFKEICITTRGMNTDLYDKMKSFLNVKNYDFLYFNNFPGYNGAKNYLYEILSLENRDWIINIDEDVFVYNEKALLILISFMKENNYDYCGMPDGGTCIHRFHSPIVMNPFFNIFNIKKIKQTINNEIEKTIYNSSMEKYIPTSYLKDGYKWENDNFEPFYPLFYWLTMNFKPLYLKTYESDDGISTIIKNHLNEDIAIHTWFSRAYYKDTFHQNRINNAYKFALEKTNMKERE